MSNKVTNLTKFKSTQKKKNQKSATMCRNGFHKWQVVKSNDFDSKQGKLVTRSVCSRCGTVKVEGR